jgi:prophage regulatory protein
MRAIPNNAMERQGVVSMSQQSLTAAAPAEHRILRRAEVEAKTGFKRAHIYSLMKEGKFPKALRLGVRAVGWDSVEVEQWIADRLNERA